MKELKAFKLSKISQITKKKDNILGSENYERCIKKCSRSSSSKGKEDIYLKTMTSFPKKYVEEMKGLTTYQRKLDKRLAQPKFKKVDAKIKKK